MKEKTTIYATTTPRQIIKSTTISPDASEEKELSEKKIIFRFYYIVWYISGIVEILLGFRFFLKALGANPFNGFSSFVYMLSDSLARPFFGIVAPTVINNTIIEWSTLIAMLVYVVIAYLLVEIPKIIKPFSNDEVTEDTTK